MARNSLNVRWYRDADLQQLKVLFAECYPDENWRRKDFRRFANRYLNDEQSNVIKVLVGKDDTVVLGAMLYTITPDECRVRRIAVPAAMRRRGYATYLLHGLVGRHSPIRRTRFTATVHEECLLGQLFLRDCSLGFHFETAYRHTYADDTLGYRFTFTRPVRAPSPLSV